MVLFNHAAHQMAAKIVYYGPGLCGKTTNLSSIYGKTSSKARGEMVSLNTDTDRTLFFDLLPMDMGMIWGFRTKLQLYTVPGQVFYNSTRKLVLKGADGVVFVADSQAQMLEANRESLRNLAANLEELGMDIRTIPLVFQWNKRDLSNLVPVEELEQELNPKHLPSFCSVASAGTGVFETLKGIARQTLMHVKERHFTSAGAPVEEPEPKPEPIPVPPKKTVPEMKPALRGKLSIQAPHKPMVSVPAPRIRPVPPPVKPNIAVLKVTVVPPHVAARLPHPAVDAGRLPRNPAVVQKILNTIDSESTAV
jgi:mutual gliding-motility protein MglA